jgi:endoglucanase
VVVGGLAIAARATSDADAGGPVRQIDLATVPASETLRYRVRVPGVGVSWRTEVSERAAARAFYVAARGMFHNRWGGDLRPTLTTWSRPIDHPTVYTAEQTDFTRFYAESTPRTGQRALAGGYHDAGDFDQRPMHTVAPQLLLRAFELDPARYRDGQLDIPESGNGIPDLLDEALWGVRAWEQLQEADGGVRQGVESYRHPWAFYYAHTDPLPYWTYARGANVTARAAGVFAQAARLVLPYNAARAAALHGRAVRAWSWAKANGASDTNKLYAAGELYRLTGEAQYKTAFEASWSAIGSYGAFSKFAENQLYMGDYTGSSRAMPDYLQGYVGAPGATPAIVSTTLSWITRAADAVVARTESDHAHRNPRPASHGMDWGQGTTMGRYCDTVIARLQLGGLTVEQRQRYFDTLSLAADYVLGANPNGLVYMTGLGSRRVEEPLHLDSLSFVKDGKGVVPGIPVYGPIAGAPAASYMQPTLAQFYPTFNAHPPALRFADVRTMVPITEFTVWETQAPHTEHFAILAGSGKP